MKRYILLFHFVLVSLENTRSVERTGTQTSAADTYTTRKCINYESKKKREVLCQEDTLHISCPNGTFISFLDANYGRSSDEPCGQFLGIEFRNCYSNKETLNILKDKCGDKINCDVYVSKDVFGKPSQCFGITKYLDVTYSCEPKGCHEITLINARQATTTDQYNSTRQSNHGNIKGVTMNNFQIDLDDITMTNVIKEPSSSILDESKSLAQSKVLKTTGIAVGCILAAVVILLVFLILNRKWHLCSRRKVTTNKIEMNTFSENNETGGCRHYSYDYTEVTTCPNTAINVKIGNENNISDSKPVENAYDVSSHVTNGTEYQTSTYISGKMDSTYDVANSNDGKTSEDVNDTYDHVFGEQSEDQYDTTVNMNTHILSQNASDVIYS